MNNCETGPYLVSVNDTPADQEDLAAVGIERQAILSPTNHAFGIARYVCNGDGIDLGKGR